MMVIVMVIVMMMVVMMTRERCIGTANAMPETHWRRMLMRTDARNVCVF